MSPPAYGWVSLAQIACCTGNDGGALLSLLTAYQSRWPRDERGVSVTEYALLAALFAVVAIAAAVFLGGELNQKLRGGGTKLG